MGYIPISSACKIFVSEYLADDNIIPYKKNCIRHFIKYVKIESKKDIRINQQKGKIYVPDTLIDDDYIIKYLKKTKFDYDAKDCVLLALNHVGVPPIGELSVESLVKTARDIMKEMKDDVYIKRTKGTSNTFCVNKEKASKVALDSKLLKKIDSQSKRAEKNHKDTIDWRAYELERINIDFLKSLDYQNSEETNYHSLTDSFKSHLMLKAMQKLLTN